MRKSQFLRTTVNAAIPVDLKVIRSLFAAKNEPPALKGFTNLINQTSDPHEQKKLILSFRDASVAGGIDTFAFWSQISALTVKVNDCDPGPLKELAISQFIETDRLCKETNARLGLSKSIPGLEIAPYIYKARALIYRLLPPLNDSVYKRILALSRPGSGSSIGSMNRFRVSTHWKYGATVPMAYPLSSGHVQNLLHSSKLWQSALKEFNVDIDVRYLCDHNRIEFVPKSSTSLRTIAIEPAGSMMIQLGVHEFFSDLLESFNSIRDQSRNQDLARVGSTTGGLSTIDLSAASDSLSLALVHQLFPSDWASFLYSLRAPSGILPDGSTILYEKFASMGNGVTFALETLVFYALSVASGSSVVSVYGDDIIVDTSHYALLVRILEGCGFSVNSDKSFSSGPFRESCGADYYNGTLVTPKYWRTSSAPTILECYSFLNSLPPRFQWGSVRNYITQAITANGHKLLFGPAGRDNPGYIIAPDSYLTGSRVGKWDRNEQRYKYREIFLRPSFDRLDKTPNFALTGLAFGTCISKAPLRDLHPSIRWV